MGVTIFATAGPTTLAHIIQHTMIRALVGVIFCKYSTISSYSGGFSPKKPLGRLTFESFPLFLTIR